MVFKKIGVRGNQSPSNHDGYCVCSGYAYFGENVIRRNPQVII